MRMAIAAFFIADHLPLCGRQFLSRAAVEGPSATQPDQDLPLRVSGLESVCWPGAERVELPSPSVSAAELVHDRAFRLLFCLVQR